MKIASVVNILMGATMLCAASSRADVIATFDNLQAPPPLNSAQSLQYTNGNSLSYEGITWDARFGIVGDEYRVGTGGPLFGLPHSGHYFATNWDGVTGMTITTDKVLTGAWFGRNQYYGFTEGGADQITIVALSGANELGTVVFDLPESHPGEPEPLSFVDTSSFAALSGLTGYRIDRREVGQQAGHWIADDFQFVNAAPVPEPETLPMLLLGIGIVGFSLLRKPRIL